VEERDDLIGHIAEAYSNDHQYRMDNIVRRIGEQHGKRMDANSVRHMLARYPRVKPCHRIPMEEKRLEIISGDIEAHFHGVVEAVEGVPAHFAYNMNKKGHQEQVDSQIKVSCVSSSHTQPRV
jgi:hypothetical protein